ncbi:MAG: ABC transporter substrate-binding protein [Candidatus Odinarchaeota archaeon]
MISKKMIAFASVAVIVTALVTVLLLSNFLGCGTCIYAKLFLSVYYSSGNEAQGFACSLLKESVETMDIDGDGTAKDIAINVEPLDQPEYLKHLGYRDRLEVFVLDWEPDVTDPDSYMMQYLNGTAEGTFAYWSQYDNPQVNGWMIEARNASDNATREILYQNIADKAAKDVAFIPLYQVKQGTTWKTVSIFLNHGLEPFDDLNARLGFAHAFPYEEAINQGLEGTEMRRQGMIPEGMLGYTGEFPYDYNVTKAIDYFRTGGVGMPATLPYLQTKLTELLDRWKYDVSKPFLVMVQNEATRYWQV